jgi:hypothetical protein
MTGKALKNVTSEDIERVRTVLASLPERSVDRVTRKDAVALLEPEVRAMQQRGYSVTEIAAILTENGIAVSLALFRAYLGSARRARADSGTKTGGGSEAFRQPSPPPPARSVRRPAGRRGRRQGVEG